MKKLLFAFVFLVFSLAFFIIGFGVGEKEGRKNLYTVGPFYLPKEGIVVKVYDGDTIEIRSLAEIPSSIDTVLTRDVRYLGIDAPDKGEKGYQEAKSKNEEMVGGKRVQLVYEAEQNDKYGRILARVFISGKDVGKELVQLGLAMEIE